MSERLSNNEDQADTQRVHHEYPEYLREQIHNLLIAASRYLEENNLTEAVRLFQQAADRGDISALYNLGAMHYYGIGVPSDLPKAARYFLAAAKKGDAPSQYNIAVMLNYGEGVKQDTEEAIAYYRKAAGSGHPGALVALSEKYEKGIGVAKNKGLARELIKKAAEQNYPSAQAIFGSYLEREGNIHDAMQLYFLSAEQGYIPAQRYLGKIHLKGIKGVAPDPIISFRYFLLAERAGDEEAKKAISDLVSSGSLSEDQIAELRREVAEMNISPWDGKGVTQVSFFSPQAN